MKYTDEQKHDAINRYANGESVLNIVSDSQIPRSTIYSWIKENQNNNSSKKKEVNLRNFRAFEKKVARLEGIIEILQNINCAANSPLDIKLAVLEELYGQYSVHMIYDALKVPRGTLYNHIFRNKRDNTWYSKAVKNSELESNKYTMITIKFWCCKNHSNYERRRLSNQYWYGS